MLEIVQDHVNQLFHENKLKETKIDLTIHDDNRAREQCPHTTLRSERHEPWTSWGRQMCVDEFPSEDKREHSDLEWVPMNHCPLPSKSKINEINKKRDGCRRGGARCGVRTWRDIRERMSKAARWPPATRAEPMTTSKSPTWCAKSAPICGRVIKTYASASPLKKKKIKIK